MSEVSQTADHCLQVLLQLEDCDGLTLSELSNRLGVSGGATERLVMTLRSRAMVIRDESGRFFLGPGLIAIADRVPHVLASAAEPELLHLSQTFRETVVLSVRSGDDARVITSRIGSNGPLRVEYEAGYAHALSTGASGLAILAHLDLHTRERLFPGGEERLAEIRAQGYVLSEGQIRQQMTGLAAPIIADGHVVGSMAIIVPSTRAASLKHVAEPLLASARTIGAHPALRSKGSSTSSDS